MRLNTHLALKIQKYPKNKYKIMVAIFMHSMFDFLKELILNFFLFAIVKNISCFSFIMLIVVFGVRHLKKMKYLKLSYLISVGFIIRVFSVVHFKDRNFPKKLFEFPEILNFLNDFLAIKNPSIIGFKIEVLCLGMISFLIIPTVLLIKIVFKDFHNVKH